MISGQRIGEILVLAAAEAVPRHDHPAAERRVVRIERGERLAFVRRQQRTNHGAAMGVEITRDQTPVECAHALGDGGRGPTFSLRNCGVVGSHDILPRLPLNVAIRPTGRHPIPRTKATQWLDRNPPLR